MAMIPIDDVEAWRENFERIRNGVLSSCQPEDAGPLLVECDRIAQAGAVGLEYSEDEYLKFARSALDVASRDSGGARLALSLSRVHCEVGEFVRGTGLTQYVAEAALANPFDFTGANRVFVSDMIYSALVWHAEQELRVGGVTALIGYLRSHPYFASKDGEFARRSIVRSISTMALRNDESSLDAIAEAFASDPGIVGDLIKVRKSRA